jgi:serine protease
VNARRIVSLLLLILGLLILLIGWKVKKRGYLLPGTVSITVDDRVAPHIREIPGFDNDPPRPVAALTDGKGTTTSFVENEFIVMTDDAAAASEVATRCGGTVVRTFAPRDFGLESPSYHLIRMADPKSAEAKRLTSDLQRLNPGKSGQLIVSSEAGRGLLAAASGEAAAGRAVSLNFVMHPSGFRDKNLTEGMPPPPSFETFTRNPVSWSYIMRGGNQHIGVDDAWRALDETGRLSHWVRVAVIDGGFLPSDDNPSDWTHHTNSIHAMDPYRQNENECTNGTPCPWHGTNVVGTLMGVANNGFGAAGPAGPVANAITIRMSGDVFNYLGAFGIAVGDLAHVINMSFHTSVPALLFWTMEPINAVTKVLHDNGRLLVAAAGNDGNNVDAEDCAWPFDWPCWERAWYAPCENSGVFCVGALQVNSDKRRSDSNYGREDVDIFGPGTVWVGPDLANQAVHSFDGTSAAAPFVAGVAALVMTARPMNAASVETILIETANPSTDGDVRRYVNAYAAVIRALGSTPPEITIAVETVPIFGACQPQYHFSATIIVPDNGPAQVTWTSDIDHQIGVGDSFTRTLSDGTHTITASATDAKGLSSQSNTLLLTVSNATAAPRPTIEIISLTNHQSFASNQTITFEAGGLDPSKPLGGLVAANVHWSSSKDGDLGAGQRIFRTLTPGSHHIFVNYTGLCGATVDDVRLIDVTDAVADAPPNMMITTPTGNDITIRADTSGQACLHVAGFGFDEEDKDFATIEWWETNRSDLQWKVLSFNQNTTVCLNIAPNAQPTVHQVRLRGVDRTGHHAYSAPLKVTVLPGLR